MGRVGFDISIAVGGFYFGLKLEISVEFFIVRLDFFSRHIYIYIVASFFPLIIYIYIYIYICICICIYVYVYIYIYIYIYIEYSLFLRYIARCVCRAWNI